MSKEKEKEKEDCIPEQILPLWRQPIGSQSAPVATEIKDQRSEHCLVFSHFDFACLCFVGLFLLLRPFDA